MAVIRVLTPVRLFHPLLSMEKHCNHKTDRYSLLQELNHAIHMKCKLIWLSVFLFPVFHVSAWGDLFWSVHLSSRPSDTSVIVSLCNTIVSDRKLWKLLQRSFLYQKRPLSILDQKVKGQGHISYMLFVWNTFVSGRYLKTHRTFAMKPFSQRLMSLTIPDKILDINTNRAHHAP